MSEFSKKFVESLPLTPAHSTPLCQVVSTLTKELADSADGVTADVDLFAAFNVELPSGHDLWAVRPYKYGDSQLKKVAKTVRAAEVEAKNLKVQRLAAFYTDIENLVAERSAFDLPEFQSRVYISQE